jgi:zinc D-Ala-D-Ala carboxypeptidase
MYTVSMNTILLMIAMFGWTLNSQESHMINLEEVNLWHHHASDIQTQQIRKENMLLDRSPFSNPDNRHFPLTEIIQNPNDITVIVNRVMCLDPNYVPFDLVALSSLDKTLGSNLMRQEAAYALVTLKNDMVLDTNEIIESVSGYRSYNTQRVVFYRYMDQHGFDNANRYSAIPGHSEHQTGLAIDLRIRGYAMNEFGLSTSYQWLKLNAYKYGFIERYQKGESRLSGYIHEPWHWRYVGVELATYLRENNVTLDEYWVNGVK